MQKVITFYTFLIIMSFFLFGCNKKPSTISILASVESSKDSVNVGDSLDVSLNIEYFLIQDNGVEIEVSPETDFVYKSHGEKIPITICVDYLLNNEVVASHRRNSMDDVSYKETILIPQCRTGWYKLSIHGYTMMDNWIVLTNTVIPQEVFIID